MSSSQLTNSYFQFGVGLNHQPDPQHPKKVDPQGHGSQPTHHALRLGGVQLCVGRPKGIHGHPPMIMLLVMEKPLKYRGTSILGSPHFWGDVGSV